MGKSTFSIVHPYKPVCKLAYKSACMPVCKPACKLAYKSAYKLPIKPACKPELKPARKPAMITSQPLVAERCRRMVSARHHSATKTYT